MTLFISNPSRGGAAPSTPGDPVGVRALDPIRVSLRETSSFINLSAIQMGVGYAKAHALGTGGPFDKQLARTRRGSLLSPAQYTGEPVIGVVGNGLSVQKTSSSPLASTYFTSIDHASSVNMSAMLTSVFRVVSSPAYTPGALDPLGPVLGLEHGPKRTAAYCFFVYDGTTRQIRICGPKVNNARSPDTYVTFDWSAIPDRQYILIWNDSRKQVELWTDDTTGTGGIGSSLLVAYVPFSQFQTFGINGSVPVGGPNDITGIYGVEGPDLAQASIVSAATGVEVGFPFINGARTGDWKSYLDSDISIGFSGAVDPTKLERGGIWFKSTSSADPAGQILPSAGSYCRLLKKTASTNFSIYRDEPGFRKTVSDGLSVEFKCSTDTSGGTSTGAAIQVSDGQTLFQIDFLFDGTNKNIGLLKVGGSPLTQADHFLPTTPFDYSLKTLRLVVDPRRNLIDMFDTSDLSTPVATWPFNRALLPTTATAQILVGLPVTSTTATGALDIYSLKYSYIYQAWETRDAVFPTAADPPYLSNSFGSGGSGPLSAAVMPGVLPLPYAAGGGGGSGIGTLESDGFHLDCPAGSTLYYSRSVPVDVNRGGVFEASLKITDWHPADRTGVFGILDDGLSSYILSFVETDVGRFVCIPLAAGSGQFQEQAGDIGMAAKLSVRVDWTQFHTYRLERRPRDGVYLYIDNLATPALVLLDSDRYSFPQTQFGAPIVVFGQYTLEGATSVWEFVRDFFGAGFEVSTKFNRSDADLRASLSGARATVVVTAGA